MIAIAPAKQENSRRAQSYFWLTCLAIGLLVCAKVAEAAAQEARVVARPGPWPVASQLIAYEGRIWFANSLKGRNHNSADIYSYDPESEALRYELHLFSQDAGKPVVAGGRLYWPFEDSRFNLGWGYFASGQRGTWKIGSIRNPLIFHLHVLAEMPGGRILAATSAWRAGLHVSQDGGNTWRQIYDHPTADKRVSRIVDLAVAGSRAYASLIAPEERRLLMIAEDRVQEVPGWPKNKRIRGLAAADGAIFALLGEGQEVWRSDGNKSAQTGTLPGPAWALAAGPKGDLWALGRKGKDHHLWQSQDGGKNWTEVAQLEGGLPHDLLITGTAVFIGGEGDDGRGILWQIGESSGALGASQQSSAAANTAGSPTESNELRDWVSAGRQLESALMTPESYDDRGLLRDLIADLVDARPPPDFFTQYLALPMPEAAISLIGGAVTVPRRDLGRWFLLWAMAEAGAGRIPTEILAEAWGEPNNPSEKYFAAAPLAFWALGAIGECDPAQLAGLIDRLGREDDPLWLTGDLVGALHALTGQPLAYDRQAWKRWYAGSADPCAGREP